MLTVECEKPFFSKKVLQKILSEVSQSLNIKKTVGFSLAFVLPKVIKKLNKTYRHKDIVTDVLSFPFDDQEMVGEVIICLAQAKKQAKIYNQSVENEVTILLVHGLLHLFAFDHLKKKDADKMFPLQKKILKKLKIAWSIPEYG